MRGAQQRSSSPSEIKDPRDRLGLAWQTPFHHEAANGTQAFRRRIFVEILIRPVAKRISIAAFATAGAMRGSAADRTDGDIKRTRTEALRLALSKPGARVRRRIER